MLNLGIEEPVKQAVKESGLDIDDLMAQEERTRPGQRRVRTPRRLLHGIPRQPGDSRHGLRHPLRVWHFLTRKSATAGRWKSPTNGCSTATPGEIPRPDYAVTIGFADAPKATPTMTGATGCAGCRAKRCRASPTTPPSLATRSKHH